MPTCAHKTKTIIVSQLNLKAGRSLREIADDIGVDVGDLAKHSGIADTDAPLAADQIIEIPDGFLRAADRARRSTYAAVPLKEAVVRGANDFVTLDIEYKRSLVAGKEASLDADEEEIRALEEADRNAARLEPISNDLALGLYKQLANRSKHTQVRALGFAGMTQCYVERVFLYGEKDEPSRGKALSTGKAAIMAGPKEPKAHSAYAMALRISSQNTALHQSLGHEFILGIEHIERCLDLAPKSAAGWLSMTRILLQAGDLRQAPQALAVAKSHDGTLPLIGYTEAQIQLALGQAEGAEDLLIDVIQNHEQFANAHALLGAVYMRLGDPDEAELLRDEALELTTSESHRQALRRMWEDVGNPAQEK